MSYDSERVERFFLRALTWALNQPQWVGWCVCRLDDALQWCLQVYHGPHNARVLADMEYRFACVLDHTTGRISKPYYDLPTMYAEIDDAFTRANEELLADFLGDLPDAESYTLADLYEAAGLGEPPTAKLKMHVTLTVEPDPNAR